MKNKKFNDLDSDLPFMTDDLTEEEMYAEDVEEEPSKWADPSFVEDVKKACDSIEERVYELNNIIREKSNNEEITLELNKILTTVKNIKSSVDESNAYNTRSGIIYIQSYIDKLFEKASKQR